MSLADAAQAVGASVQELWVRVQRGELAIHRVVEDGRNATAVALRDILQLYMGHEVHDPPTRSGPGPRTTVHRAEGGGPSATPRPAPASYEVPRPAASFADRDRGSRDDPSDLRSELERERIARAELEGRYESLREMESQARQRVERLESRLEQAEDELSEAKREALTLARALGQAEGQVLQLRSGRSQDDDGGEAEPKRKRRPRRRWWRR